MGIINVLDISVANLIAAGEVVERPSSAVKELIENSVDAGAKNITVEIKNGGVSYLRVTDDGSGMSAEDAVISIKRHATSKIRTAKDLAQIMTLGFRGEALAAISAVSRFRILTKRREDKTGVSLSCEYGSSPRVEEAGCPDGTTIICEALFATTPARLKFLKSDVSEAREVQNALERAALSHPEIAFRYICDGNMKISTSGNGKLCDAVLSVYGRDFASSLVPVSSESGGVGVEGYVCSPEYARGNRGMQTFFVNGRPVRSKLMTAALEQAFETYIPSGKFPSCVLNLKIH
ncbi:MAG: DNA mismatch repair endonuclease MutL, partial [Clostridiales bacterium]|nr:DNA mismatch repair endonuclease MutL [Clostridiales bacterium]